MKKIRKPRNLGRPTKIMFTLYLERDIKQMGLKKARGMDVSLASVMRSLLKEWVLEAKTNEK